MISDREFNELKRSVETIQREVARVDGNPIILASPGKRFDLNDHLNVVKLKLGIANLKEYAESSKSVLDSHNHGKGTVNRLTKYLDVNGNICDSNVFNDGENIGFNTDVPETILHLKSENDVLVTFENDYTYQSNPQLGLVDYDIVLRQSYGQSFLYQRETVPGLFESLAALRGGNGDVDVYFNVGADSGLVGRIDTDQIETGTLQITSPVKSAVDADKIAVLDYLGYLKYRTGDEIRSDIGAVALNASNNGAYFQGGTHVYSWANVSARVITSLSVNTYIDLNDLDEFDIPKEKAIGSGSAAKLSLYSDGSLVLRKYTECLEGQEIPGGTPYTIYHSGNLTPATIGAALSSHVHVELKGSNYISGGLELPNNAIFSNGKFRYQMLSVPGIGWTDTLYVSSYTGGDVKISNQIVMSKTPTPFIGFRQQNFDATTWGTLHTLYGSHNLTPATIGAVALSGSSMTGKLTVAQVSGGDFYDLTMSSDLTVNLSTTIKTCFEVITHSGGQLSFIGATVGQIIFVKNSTASSTFGVKTGTVANPAYGYSTLEPAKGVMLICTQIISDVCIWMPFKSDAVELS